MLIDDVGCTSRTGLTQPRCSAFRNDFDDGPLDVGAPGLREGADLPRGRKPPLPDVVTAAAVEPAGPRHGRIRSRCTAALLQPVTRAGVMLAPWIQQRQASGPESSHGAPSARDA